LIADSIVGASFLVIFTSQIIRTYVLTEQHTPLFPVERDQPRGISNSGKFEFKLKIRSLQPINIRKSNNKQGIFYLLLLYMVVVFYFSIGNYGVAG